MKLIAIKPVYGSIKHKDVVALAGQEFDSEAFGISADETENLISLGVAKRTEEAPAFESASDDAAS
jgi:hypothetical protein